MWPCFLVFNTNCIEKAQHEQQQMYSLLLEVNIDIYALNFIKLTSPIKVQLKNLQKKMEWLK